MNDSIFVDTNILVYAHDRQAGEKHLRAKTLVMDLWHSGKRPLISIQILQELFVNLIRKEIPHDHAKAIVEDYSYWQVMDNDRVLLMKGIEAAQRWQLSFWDGLMVAAAIKSRASLIWSEDLNHGQRFDGTRVVNPFREPDP